MYRLWVIALLSGCAAQPRERPDLLDVARPTVEQIRAEQQQDIEAAREAGEWQAYVCSQPIEEQKRLIQKTRDEQGWQMMCPRKRT